MGKSADIHAKGFRKFLAGDFMPFSGFGRTVEMQLLVALRFHSVVEWNLRGRLIKPLEEIETLTEAKFLLYGRDKPLHCTVKTASYFDDNLNFDRDIEVIESHQRLRRILKSIRGKKQVFSNLIIDPNGNGLLTEDNPAEWLREARNRISNQIGNLDRPFDLSPIDWAHVTLWRTVIKPRAEGNFETMFEKLQKELGSPIVEVEFGDFYVGTAADFLR